MQPRLDVLLKPKKTIQLAAWPPRDVLEIDTTLSPSIYQCVRSGRVTAYPDRTLGGLTTIRAGTSPTDECIVLPQQRGSKMDT